MSQEKLITYLKTGNPKAIALLYEYFPVVKNYILKNSGSVDDAKDVFQESLIILYKKLQSDKFKLSSKIETFVFGISKNIWFEELRKRTKINHSEIDISQEFGLEIEEHLEQEKKFKQLDDILNALGEKCLQILKRYYYENKTMLEIAKSLAYKNVNTVKTQKYKCLERAKKLAVEKNVNLKNRVS